MATLNNPHWESVPPFLQEIFVHIGKFPFASRFYLAGGTALAFQLGHRLSVDLDFFSQTDEINPQSRREISDALQQKFAIDLADAGLGSLLLGFQGSYVGFNSYSYPLLALTVELEGIALAGLLDIGLMKMDAIVGRGTRKDYYDLFFIAKHIPLDQILERGKDKFPYVRDFAMMVLTALPDFSIADQQSDIQTTPIVSWESVKLFFEEESRRIGREWFE